MLNFDSNEKFHYSDEDDYLIKENEDLKKQIRYLKNENQTKIFELSLERSELDRKKKEIEKKTKEFEEKEKKYYEKLEKNNSERYLMLSDNAYNRGIEFMNKGIYKSAINEFESCLSNLESCSILFNSERVRKTEVNKFIVKCYIELKDYENAYITAKNNSQDLTYIKEKIYENLLINFQRGECSLERINQFINSLNKYNIQVPNFLNEMKLEKEYQNQKNFFGELFVNFEKNLEEEILEKIDENDCLIESLKNDFDKLIDFYKKYENCLIEYDLKRYKLLLRNKQKIIDKYSMFVQKRTEKKNIQEDLENSSKINSKFELIKLKLPKNEFDEILSLFSEIDILLNKLHSDFNQSEIISLKNEVHLIYNKFKNNDFSINEIMKRFSNVSTDRIIFRLLKNNFNDHWKKFFNKNIDEEFIKDLIFIIEDGTSEASFPWYLFGYTHDYSSTLINNIIYKFEHYRPTESQIEYAIPFVLE